ncbi:hypothetical protein QCA50_005631 [Cerrena zonata]|uniref:Uncharacterized protein n=1 Tax=Cerrena zonata TaxID=2478898 RepID=A0AAW0GA70_9APHY
MSNLPIRRYGLLFDERACATNVDPEYLYDDEHGLLRWVDVNRGYIISTINSVWDRGITVSLINQLTSFLIPNNTMYHDTCHRVSSDFRALTLWIRLRPSARRHFRAAYMVPFFLDVSGPHSAVILATFLLWFLDKAIRDFILNDDAFNPRGLPFLKNIVYFLYPRGAYGVFFVDDGLGHWYNTLLEASYTDNAYPRLHVYNCIVATYPNNYPSLRTAPVIERCWNVTKPLYTDSDDENDND